MRVPALCANALVATYSAAAGAQVPANGTVTGEVRDSLGAPLAHIEAWAMPSGPGKFTDARGRFVLSGLAAGSHRIIVRSIGFEPELNDVEVRDSGTVALRVELHRLPPILAAQVVNAQRERLPRVYERIEKHIGAAIFSDDIMRASAHDLSAALRFSPRMQSQLSAPRGCGAPAFFIDGRHVPPRGWSDDDAGTLFAADAFVRTEDIAVIEAFKSPDFVNESFLADDGALTRSSAFPGGLLSTAGPIKGGAELSGMKAGGSCQRLVMIWTKYYVSRQPRAINK